MKHWLLAATLLLVGCGSEPPGPRYWIERNVATGLYHVVNCGRNVCARNSFGFTTQEEAQTVINRYLMEDRATEGPFEKVTEDQRP